MDNLRKVLSIETVEEDIKGMMKWLFPLQNVGFPMMKTIVSEGTDGLKGEEYRKQLSEISGVYGSFDKKNGRIIIECDMGEVAQVYLTTEAVVNNKIPLTRGEHLHVIGWNVCESVYVSVCILRDDESQVIRTIPDVLRKIQLIKGFLNLSEGRKQRILQMQKLPEHELYRADADSYFALREDWELKYWLTKANYPIETQAAIELLIKEIPIHKSKAKEKLECLLNINPVCAERKPINKGELRDILDRELYGLEKAKNLLVDVFVSNEKAGKRGCVILLVGSPGVGKTTLAECVAMASNIPYERIPMNGMAEPLELEGLDSDYDGSSMGRFAKASHKYRTSEMVCLLDEIDKTSVSREGDPLNCLYQIFNGTHEDKFLEVKIPTNNTIFIATANSLDNLPEPLLNRFHAIIKIADYSFDEKMEIAQQYALPKILHNFGLTQEQVMFSEEAIECILKNFCEDAGARDLQHNIEWIIRRIMSDTSVFPVEIDVDDVYDILGELVDSESYGIRFNRFRECYSEPVANEIKRWLAESKCAGRNNKLGSETDLAAKKLEYLLACRTEKKNNVRLSPAEFKCKLKEHHYGMDQVMEEITTFYYLSGLSSDAQNANLALCGGMGVGKTSICKKIAEAMGYHFCKISLNGVKDARELKGFPSTYVNSEGGRILKAIKEAGSLRTLVQLDEVDKLSHELAYVLLDLLDREYTDSFLDATLDLSQMIFVATANDWQAVDPLIRDRFTLIEVPGYTGKDKECIVEKYIIPKIEKRYMAEGVTVAMDESARRLLIESHCTSFGVRDLEKCMQKLVGSKLRENDGKENARTIVIDSGDVLRILGEPPIPRGNFPEGDAMPGVSRALAVSERNVGNTFAIETVLVPCEKEALHITGLPKESAVDSVKIALTYVKRFYPELIKNKEIYLHFAEGAIPKDGPSAGVAILMSILSAAKGSPIMDQKPYDIAFTGELDLMGGVYAVGKTLEKIQAADRVGCSRVFVPKQNYDRLEVAKLKEFNCRVIPVSHISEVIDQVFV